MVTVTALLLAQEKIDPTLWVYLAVAAISVLGSLLSKLGKRREQPAPRPGARSGPPGQRPRPTAARRLSQPALPNGATPTEAPPPTERPAASAATAPRPPVARPVRPRPAPSVGAVSRPRPAVRRPPEQPVPAIVVAEVQVGPAAVAGPAVEVVPLTTQEPAVALPPDEKTEAAPARPVGVQRLLRDERSLRSAIVLSEILAPPLALRDNPVL